MDGQIPISSNIRRNLGRITYNALTMFLLDTNVLVPSLIANTDESKWLRAKLREETMIISSIVAAEFLTKANKKDEAKLKELIKLCGVADINFQIAVIAAEYRKKYHKKTKPTYMLDCLIAATAKANKATLYTYNDADFPMQDISVQKPL